VKVKIIKCSVDTYWYFNHIGEVFDVVTIDAKDQQPTLGQPLDDTEYMHTAEKGDVYYIKTDDCEITDAQNVEGVK